MDPYFTSTSSLYFASSLARKLQKEQFELAEQMRLERRLIPKR